MKQQQMYRSEPKKAKPTKMDKAYDYVEKMKKRVEMKKKEAAA